MTGLGLWAMGALLVLTGVAMPQWINLTVLLALVVLVI